MNVQEAIAELNATRLQTLQFRDCVKVITQAAVHNNDSDAHNFLFLCRWKIEQLPN